MSMLAERRQKQKWTLNPRGKQWSEDGEKFGQKMLEKMGWTSGKGLGANEQGITEHVRVSVKNDKSGIGFKQDTLEEAWTEHQESFNDFLQKLQTEQSESIVQIEEANTELSGKSLELKSKQSRARVHYQKFTRGKDVNKYSSKDLANIFGQKEININKGSKVTNTKEEEEESCVAINTPENNNGVIVINGGSMTDYFMKKGKDISLMSKRKKKPESNSESEPEYAGFGFASPFGKAQSRNEENKEMKNSSNYAFENPCMELNSPEIISNSTEVVSHKKRKSVDETESSLNQSIKKFKEDNVGSIQYENGIVNAALNLDSQSEDVYNGQEFEVSRVQFGLANSALDLSDEVEKKRVTFNDHVEYSTDSIKKKKGRTKLDKFEVENKKAKKKKKKQEDVKNSLSFGFINEALDTEDKPEEISDNEINERKSKKSKKRKESRRSNLETIVEIPEEDKETYEDEIENKNINADENISEVQENVSHKKSKKKKRKEEVKEISTDDRTNTEEIVETNLQPEKGECELEKDQGNISKEKKKKKKKKERVDPDIQHEDVSNIKASDEVGDDNEKTEEDAIKVKKNKKKKKDASVMDSNIEVENVKKEKENIDNVHDNTFETKKEKDKNSIDESTVDNNNFTHSTEVTRRNHVYQRNTMFKTVSSPWREKTKMSKKILRSFFNRNSVAQFPGANISEIKGYGVNIQ